MKNILELRGPDDATAVAGALLRTCRDRKVFTFSGPMGVGKTTLIKALCRQLGVKDGLSSPSFSIVNEYRSTTGATVYHFDLYRLEKAEELEGIGFTEYLDSGHYCFVEWPELGLGLYPPGTVEVAMRMSAEEARVLEFELPSVAASYPHEHQQ